MKKKTDTLPPQEVNYTRLGLLTDKKKKELENQVLLKIVNNMRKEIDKLKYYRTGFYTLLAIVLVNLIIKIL